MTRSSRTLRARHRLAFAVVAFTTAVSLLAVAQPRRPAKPDAPPSSPSSSGPSRDAGAGGGAVLEARTSSDGGARVYRFGEVEVEGRLKSPQIVYFLRRVRAEFAAGDLGHRTFLREMSGTRSEPGF